VHSLYWKANKYIKNSAFIFCSSIVVLSLLGASQDIQNFLKDIRQYGTECTFRARILEKTDDKNGLVVQKAPATDVREKRIYVLITRDTKIGYQVFYPQSTAWHNITYDDLKEENHVLINGLKMIEKEDNQEIMYVEAKRIELSE
jgi:hypothetical protein